MKKKITKAIALKHLFDNISVNEVTGCWEWTGSTTRDGYGQLSRDSIGKEFGAKGAHRLAKMLIDDWVPASNSEHTRHRCHNRPCINPDHLETGSARDNALDRVRDGTMANGQEHPNAKLSDDDVRTIRRERASGVRAAVLAERFSVGIGHICNIVAGRARKHK